MTLSVTNTFGRWWVWRHAYRSHRPQSSLGLREELRELPGARPPLWNKVCWFGGLWLAGCGFQELRESALLATSEGSRVERMPGVTSCRRNITSIQEVQAKSWAWPFGNSALPQLGLSCVSFTMILPRVF